MRPETPGHARRRRCRGGPLRGGEGRHRAVRPEVLACTGLCRCGSSTWRRHGNGIVGNLEIPEAARNVCVEGLPTHQPPQLPLVLTLGFAFALCLALALFLFRELLINELPLHSLILTFPIITFAVAPLLLAFPFAAAFLRARLPLARGGASALPVTLALAHLAALAVSLTTSLAVALSVSLAVDNALFLGLGEVLRASPNFAGEIPVVLGPDEGLVDEVLDLLQSVGHGLPPLQQGKAHDDEPLPLPVALGAIVEDNRLGVQAELLQLLVEPRMLGHLLRHLVVHRIPAPLEVRRRQTPAEPPRGGEAEVLPAAGARLARAREEHQLAGGLHGAASRLRNGLRPPPRGIRILEGLAQPCAVDAQALSRVNHLCLTRLALVVPRMLLLDLHHDPDLCGQPCARPPEDRQVVGRLLLLFIEHDIEQVVHLVLLVGLPLPQREDERVCGLHQFHEVAHGLAQDRAHRGPGHGHDAALAGQLHGQALESAVVHACGKRQQDLASLPALLAGACHQRARAVHGAL
mmetsp:Transcript_38780/g.107816  ORF Transcript_38780/g.107816 Transcript_38780/m.107816 type:complete len:521 (+) Transcript_38780:1580-3142(+)